MFIVFEGIDGCGKTTQAKALADWLTEKGYSVVLTSEPTKGRMGQFIREILSGKEKLQPESLALLFTADRYEHLVNEVVPAIEEGKVVISERYYYSTIAYQTAQGVDRTWLFEMNKFVVKPDLVIFLDVKPKMAVLRKEGKEIFEDREFLEKVYSQYVNFQDMQRIDGSKEQPEVFNRITALVSRLMK